MTPEINIIHQLSENKIFEVISHTESDLKAWLANGNYLISQPLIQSVKKRATAFDLVFQHPDDLYASLANDCNRFCQAAIESMWSMNKVNKLPKSTGWASVQMYYSAFFAAHAILRIFGRSCTQFDAVHVDKVYDIAKATSMHGGVGCIEQGFYSSIVINSEIKFRKQKDSHADTWACFSELLTWLIDNIKNQTTGLGKNKDAAFTMISNLKSAIHRSGASKGNWLSQVRNRINYQHSHGVWYPYKGALHNQNMVLRNSEWIKNPNSFDLSLSNNEISSLHNISNCILSLMYYLIKHGYDRAGKKSLPLTNGAFRLINQILAA